jgi:hypothetical protein
MSKASFASLTVFCFAILLLFSCESVPANEDSHDQIDQYILMITDSIGVEHGDSNKVFGAVYAIENGPSGNVFVLDVCSNTISEFRRSGEFVRFYGGAGSGPGELTMPGYFTVTDEANVYVIDSYFYLEYLPDGTLMHQAELSQLEHPQSVESLSEGRILGILSEYDVRSDGHYIVNRVAVWQDTIPEFTKTYLFEVEYKLSTEEFVNDITRIDYFPILFAGNDDYICIAPNPVDDPTVYRFDTAGSPIDTIILPYEPVLKTDRELVDEKLFIEYSVYTNSFGSVSIDWTPEPYRPLIKNLGIDSSGVLWVQRGTELTPTFDLIGMNGEITGSAVLPDRENAIYWHFEIDPAGIIAFDRDPKDYQRIFLLEYQ